MDWLADDDTEQAAPTHQNTQAQAWKILVVDDEEEVHRVTRLALRRFSHEGRTVDLLNANNGAEACVLIEQHPDIAVVFLDVVMETDDAGLRVIEHIRERLGNKFVRIIVRTGQAGRAPEIAIVAKYDINGYREKTELTSDKLLSQLYTALSSYRDIMALNAEMVQRREAANKLVQQYAQLQEANRRLEHFAKAASHDLQEPLRKIQMWADRLSKIMSDHKDEKVNDIVSKLFWGSKKISDLIVEIKRASMLESDEPEIIHIDVNELLIEVFEEELEASQAIQPELKIEELPVIQGDRSSLKLLFSSLIKSIALNNPAQEEVKIRVKQGEQAADHVQILISDQGEGIAPDEMQKIYEPYSNVVINGVACKGIGLYLSKRIAQVHGGDIDCVSEFGKGTEVRIVLPLNEQATLNATLQHAQPVEEAP